MASRNVGSAFGGGASRGNRGNVTLNRRTTSSRESSRQASSPTTRRVSSGGPVDVEEVYLDDEGRLATRTVTVADEAAKKVYQEQLREWQKQESLRLRKQKSVESLAERQQIARGDISRTSGEVQEITYSAETASFETPTAQRQKVLASQFDTQQRELAADKAKYAGGPLTVSPAPSRTRRLIDTVKQQRSDLLQAYGRTVKSPVKTTYEGVAGRSLGYKIGAVGGLATTAVTGAFLASKTPAAINAARTSSLVSKATTSAPYIFSQGTVATRLGTTAASIYATTRLIGEAGRAKVSTDRPLTSVAPNKFTEVRDKAFNKAVQETKGLRGVLTTINRPYFANKAVFERELITGFREQGLRGSELKAAVSKAKEEVFLLGTTEIIQAVNIESSIERYGTKELARKGITNKIKWSFDKAGIEARKAVWPVMARAGFTEAAVGELSTQQTYREPRDWLRVGKAGLYGAGTASLIGGEVAAAQAVMKSTKAKFTLGAAYVLDPYESVGDFAVSYGRGRSQVFTPAFSFTSTKSNKPKVAFTATFSPSSQISKTIIPSSVPSKTRSSFFSSVPSSVSVPSTFPSVVPSSVPSTFPSVVPSSVPSNVPSTVPSSVPSNVPSSVPTTVPITVPVIDLGGDFPFFPAFGGGGRKRKSGTGTRKPKTKFSTSFSAVQLGKFTNKGASKGYTGFEIRGG
jgi:hypothetical protein